MVAIDAIFGLPRKKSAGSSYQDPLFGSLYFSEQSSVDEFVGTYTVKNWVLAQHL